MLLKVFCPRLNYRYYKTRFARHWYGLFYNFARLLVCIKARYLQFQKRHFHYQWLLLLGCCFRKAMLLLLPKNKGLLLNLYWNLQCFLNHFLDAHKLQPNVYIAILRHCEADFRFYPKVQKFLVGFKCHMIQCVLVRPDAFH